jgi:hypothetical protein
LASRIFFRRIFGAIKFFGGGQIRRLGGLILLHRGRDMSQHETRFLHLECKSLLAWISAW